MKNTFLILWFGWLAVTFGLFIAIIAGYIYEEYFTVNGGALIVQAVVMSLIVVPSILYLYQKLYKITGKKEKPSYSLTRLHHIFSGFIFVIGLGMIGLFISGAIGWVNIVEWHPPKYWLGALFINMLIAFFYEALPEELALRGLVYDVLRNRFAIWFSVLLQTFIFMTFSIGVTFLQAVFGMASFEISIIFNLILLFFFGISLALIRVYTGSLWAAIGFHLGYLVTARFIIMPEEYGAPPVVTLEGTIGKSLIIDIIMFGSIIILLILLLIKNWRQ